VAAVALEILRLVTLVLGAVHGSAAGASVEILQIVCTNPSGSATHIGPHMLPRSVRDDCKPSARRKGGSCQAGPTLTARFDAVDLMPRINRDEDERGLQVHDPVEPAPVVNMDRLESKNNLVWAGFPRCDRDTNRTQSYSHGQARDDLRRAEGNRGQQAS